MAAVAGLSALVPCLRCPFAVLCESTAALLAALATGLGCAFGILGKTFAAVLTALAPRLGCTLAILGKIAGTAAMFGSCILHHLILC
jgi:hypothetical protein